MKCISLIQPWASLVLFGEKRYETQLVHGAPRPPTHPRVQGDAVAVCQAARSRAVQVRPRCPRHQGRRASAADLNRAAVLDALPTAERRDSGVPRWGRPAPHPGGQKDAAAPRGACGAAAARGQ